MVMPIVQEKFFWPGISNYFELFLRRTLVHYNLMQLLPHF